MIAIILLLINTLFIHNTNMCAFQEQHTINNSENLLKSLQEELKDPSYRTEILPNNFSHLTQLIVAGNSNNQPASYLRSTLKLFSNMLKSTQYINCYEFESFTRKLPALVQPYFSLPASKPYIQERALYDAHMFDRFKATVNNILYIKFSTEYETFRKSPGDFLDYLSSEILTIAQEEITREQLRQGIIRFLEISLSKILWNPDHAHKSWDTTKKIADNLATLLEQNILDDLNDLDDLYWSLLTRYCYFVNLAAIDLIPSFYPMIKKDIASGNTLLFELDEQDTLVEPKLLYLQRTLIGAEAQSRAYHKDRFHDA